MTSSTSSSNLVSSSSSIFFCIFFVSFLSIFLGVAFSFNPNIVILFFSTASMTMLSSVLITLLPFQ